MWTKLELTEQSRCKKVIISAALVLRLLKASTIISQSITRLTIQVIMSDVHVIYAIVGEAWCDRDVLLFHIEDEREETFYI